MYFISGFYKFKKITNVKKNKKLMQSFFISKGIRGTRIDVRALGNKLTSGLPNRVDLRVIGQ